MPSDRLYRFLFDNADVRGEIVQLEDVYREVVGRAAYPAAVAQIVGEGLAAVCLLTATLKFHGSLTLQIQAEGPLRLLVVQAGSDGTIRAMARADGDVPADAPLHRQARNGALAITIDPEDANDRYQGVVDLAPGSLAAAIEKYFRDSEQLDTRVWLRADAQGVGGMLLQRMPEQATDDEDAWDRACHLADTITDEELRTLPPPDIIRRLFHEEDIRLFDPFPFRFHCRCSRERVAGLIRSLGEEEARDILQEQGRIEIRCDFCNEPYRFDAVDVEEVLVDPAERSPHSDNRH